jgi:hypothetical protein
MEWENVGVWSSETLQACLKAGVVALADALELAACWPRFVAWFATSEPTLSEPAQVLVVEAGWHCCCCCSRWHHGCVCWPSNDCEEASM